MQCRCRNVTDGDQIAHRQGIIKSPILAVIFTHPFTSHRFLIPNPATPLRKPHHRAASYRENTMPHIILTAYRPFPSPPPPRQQIYAPRFCTDLRVTAAADGERHNCAARGFRNFPRVSAGGTKKQNTGRHAPPTRAGGYRRGVPGLIVRCEHYR